MAGNNPMFNASGCKDPTAYEAISHVTHDKRELNHKVHKLIEIIKELINFAGFEVIGRIQIRHKKTGKEFK